MTTTMRQMLEAGVHFGHQTRYWNPKMAPFIFGHRNKIHIINLEQTLALYNEAAKFVRKLAANKGVILFVGTKRQAREIVREEAIRGGMPFVDHRWLGGMLTNFKTVKQSIKRLKEMEAHGRGRQRRAHAEEGGARTSSASSPSSSAAWAASRTLDGLPDALFVIDVGYHKGAVAEAKKLGIPIVGRGRHQPFAGRDRLRDPGQRRLEPRDPALRPRHRRRGARGQIAIAAGDRRRLGRRVRGGRGGGRSVRRRPNRSQAGASKPPFFRCGRLLALPGRPGERREQE